MLDSFLSKIRRWRLFPSQFITTKLQTYPKHNTNTAIENIATKQNNSHHDMISFSVLIQPSLLLIVQKLGISNKNTFRVASQDRTYRLIYQTKHNGVENYWLFCLVLNTFLKPFDNVFSVYYNVFQLMQKLPFQIPLIRNLAYFRLSSLVFLFTARERPPLTQWETFQFSDDFYPRFCSIVNVISKQYQAAYGWKSTQTIIMMYI